MLQTLIKDVLESSVIFDQLMITILVIWSPHDFLEVQKYHLLLSWQRACWCTLVTMKIKLVSRLCHGTQSCIANHCVFYCFLFWSTFIAVTFFSLRLSVQYTSFSYHLYYVRLTDFALRICAFLVIRNLLQIRALLLIILPIFNWLLIIWQFFNLGRPRTYLS